MVWNTSRLRADVVEKLTRANAAFQTEDSNAPFFFIQAFDELESILRKVWSEHGHGGIFGLGTLPIREHHSYYASPVMMGCWLAGSLISQKEEWLGMRAAQKGRTVSDEINYTQIDVKSLLSILAKEQALDLETLEVSDLNDVFEKQVGQYVRPVILSSLHQPTLEACGEYWQKEFCVPVGNLIGKYTIPPSCESTTVAHIYYVLNLWRCYCGSDFALFPTQKKWMGMSLSDESWRGSLRRCVHDWLLEVVNLCKPEAHHGYYNPQNDPIYKFLDTSIRNNHQEPKTWQDNKSIPYYVIKPFAFYRISYYNYRSDKYAKISDEKNILQQTLLNLSVPGFQTN
jgi:hypothetical protein